ncbi:hypothetical protein VNO78_05646 [Psophocarpus tetragonolobus]|uniref:Uncharacterized protein n=1 Tax=Psophocarpus tetragonolobus TaxID=3891 RepID=A0AAN9SU41_PSOTE
MRHEVVITVPGHHVDAPAISEYCTCSSSNRESGIVGMVCAIDSHCGCDAASSFWTVIELHRNPQVMGRPCRKYLSNWYAKLRHQPLLNGPNMLLNQISFLGFDVNPLHCTHL